MPELSFAASRLEYAGSGRPVASLSREIMRISHARSGMGGRPEMREQNRRKGKEDIRG
jgi:hypothetical protein